MTRKARRAYIVTTAFLFLSFSIAIIFYTLRQNISYFYNPSDIEQGDINSGRRIRIGGLVEEGTIVKETATRIKFSVKDQKKSFKIIYEGGVLPDLFRENQSIIAEGHFREDGIFLAQQILAKHDENYMPKSMK